MSENGKVNWKSDDGVLLQELWRPNRSEEGSGKPAHMYIVNSWFCPANDGKSVLFDKSI
jgi:hypothetical protein